MCNCALDIPTELFIVLCFYRNRTDPSSSMPVHRVVYVDQHGKVLAQHTAPAVILDS